MRVLRAKKKADMARPGTAAATSGRYAMIASIAFIAVCAIAVALQILEIGVPGMAWYVYQ